MTVPEPGAMPEPDENDDGGQDDDYESGAEPERSSLRDRVYDAVILARYHDRPQQIVTSQAAVREIAAILRSLARSDEPSIRYEIGNADGGRHSLRLWADLEDSRLSGYQPEAVIVPALAEAVTKIRPAVSRAASTIRPGRNRRGQTAACQFCGAVPGVSTLALYRVSSPALSGRELVLCQNHAASEMATPGAVALPV